MDCGIYQIKNLLSNKVYIGQSVHLYNRLKDHINSLKRNGSRCRYLQNSFNKYGTENFEFKILLYCEPEELTYYEDAIEKSHRPNCYNIRECADSNKGFKHSEETKQKLSASTKEFGGHPMSIESRQKLSATNMGHFVSMETRQKLSIAQLGKSAPNKGRKMSAEFKLRCSLAHKGKTLSEETKLKLISKLTGHPVSEETRRKISLANKGTPPSNKGHAMSEEQKKKISLANKGKHISNETRKKMSDAHKKNWGLDDVIQTD